LNVSLALFELIVWFGQFVILLMVLLVVREPGPYAWTEPR
jgi:hypothetical protein